VYPDQPGDLLNEEFFSKARNVLGMVLPEAAALADSLKVIQISQERPDASLEISMDGERALAYFARPTEGVRRAPPTRQEVIVL
jgi:hypothetical protein